jgi:hypothetical protein
VALAVSSGLGWLGAVALLFGLLSLILQLFSASPSRPSTCLDLGNFVIGLLLLGIALASNLETLRERLRRGGARRAGKYGTSAVLSAGLSVALLALLAFLSTRYHVRWDWTESGSHSLTEQTTTWRGRQDVEVTAFYQPVRAAAATCWIATSTTALQGQLRRPQARPGLVKELAVGRQAR